MPNEKLAAVEMNDRNQSVLIAPNVEYHESANGIGRTEVTPHVGEILPLRPLRDPIPGFKRRLCLRMLLPEIAKLRLRDYVHLRAPVYRECQSITDATDGWKILIVFAKCECVNHGSAIFAQEVQACRLGVPH